jgi:hypothetical protein
MCCRLWFFGGRRHGAISDARLAAIVRALWQIENRLHWVLTEAGEQLIPDPT